MKRIFENIKIAFKSLALNKLRSFLTMLGIIIGVGSVVAIMSVGTAAETSITENIESIGTNVITITPGRDQTFSGNREIRLGSNVSQPGNTRVIGNTGGPEEQQNASMSGFWGGEEEKIVAGELYLEDVSTLKQKSDLLEEVVPVLTGGGLDFSYKRDRKSVV